MPYLSLGKYIYFLAILNNIYIKVENKYDIREVVVHAFNPSTWGGRDRRIPVNSRPAWSSIATSRTDSKGAEKSCLAKPKKKEKEGKEKQLLGLVNMFECSLYL